MTIPGSSFLMDNKTSCLPCTPEEEKQTINELRNVAESNLKEGDLFYVLSNRWFIKWQKYIGEDIATDDFPIDMHSCHPLHSNGVPMKKVDRPGQIDNTLLILNGCDVEGDELVLKRNLEEGRDYILVHQEVWKKLHF